MNCLPIETDNTIVTVVGLDGHLKLVGSLACGDWSLVISIQKMLRKKKMLPAIQRRPGR